MELGFIVGSLTKLITPPTIFEGKKGAQLLDPTQSTQPTQTTIFEGIKGAQLLDPELVKIRDGILEMKESTFSLSEDGILHLDGRLCHQMMKA